MTKIVEEAAKRFADMKTTKQAGSSVERDKKALLMTQFFRFALEELPLSQRLTAREKERVRKIYYDAERGEVNGHYDVYPDPCEVMRVIFGSDFFKEGE